MNSRLIGIWLFTQNFIESEKGQDLVEYSMAFSAIALGTVAGMTSVATAVLAVFTTITTIFTSKFN
ncbi:MAG TPA: Flp family type IVb pilin [Terracidiphilus sp.]|jgi:Flp pilus assembly pilin Flp|nr:Flp family type IVb pilin [Terracidiphilus sp.]